TDYQGAVKVLLAAFPLTMMNAIGFTSKKTKNLLLPYLVIVCVSVFPGFLNFTFYSFYAIGYADPLLAAAIAVSLMLLLHYCSNPLKKEYLFFAVLCGITASLSKQPGLLWCYMGFPALLITKAFVHKKIDKFEIAALLLLFIPAAIWLFGPGSRF